MQSRFGIELDSETLLLIPLECRYLVEDGTWKRFTLLGQSLGSIWLTLEGLRKGLIPDIWIGGLSNPLCEYKTDIVVCRYDGLRLCLSAGQSSLSNPRWELYALPNDQVRLSQLFPEILADFRVISTDMLRRVAERQQGHTNHSRVARSTILTYLKLMLVLYPVIIFVNRSLFLVAATTTSLRSCTRYPCVVQMC